MIAAIAYLFVVGWIIFAVVCLVGWMLLAILNFFDWLIIGAPKGSRIPPPGRQTGTQN